MFLPLSVNTKEMAVLIVGGGCIACRKAEHLLSYGIDVSLVAPVLSRDMGHETCKFTWLEGVYSEDHIQGFKYVVAATDDPALNHDIYLACQLQGAMCLDVSNSGGSDFHLPGVVRRGPIQISVSTSGQSPGMTKIIKDDIEENFKSSWLIKTQEIHKIRQIIKATVACKSDRHDQLKALATLSLEDLMKRRQAYENKDRL